MSGRARAKAKGRGERPVAPQHAAPGTRAGHPQPAAPGARARQPQPAAPGVSAGHPQPAVSGARARHPQPAAPGVSTGHPQPAAPGARARHPQLAAPGVSTTHPQPVAPEVSAGHPQLASPGALAGHPQFAAPGASAGHPQLASPGASAGPPQFTAPRASAGHPQLASPGASAGHLQFAVSGTSAEPPQLASLEALAGHPQFAVPGASAGPPQFAVPGASAGPPQFAVPGASAGYPQFAVLGALADYPQFAVPEPSAGPPQFAVPGALAGHFQLAVPGTSAEPPQLASPGVSAGPLQFVPGASAGPPQFAVPGVSAGPPQFAVPGASAGYPQFASPGALAGHFQFAVPGTLAEPPQLASPGASAGHPQLASPGASAGHLQFAVPGASAGPPQLASPGVSTGHPQFVSPGVLAGPPQLAVPGAIVDYPQFAVPEASAEPRQLAAPGASAGYSHPVAFRILETQPQPAAARSSAAHPPLAAPGGWGASGAAAAAQQPCQIPPRHQSWQGKRWVVQPEQPEETEGASALSETQLAARLQAASLRARRRRRGIFGDLVVNTRQWMEHVKESKTGSEGKSIKLYCNHFQVRARPQTVAYKYSVNCYPVGDETLHEHLLLELENLFGNHQIFDGNSILLSYKLRENYMILSRTFHHRTYFITIEFSKELQPSDPDFLRYYNILFRRILKKMEMKQLGRNYYRNDKKIELRSENLKIWCGYITSVLQYEDNITLCADVIHKLIRIETAFDVIRNLVGEGEVTRQIRALVDKELVGSIVFTTYNNKTYRVDGVNWRERPTSRFKTSEGMLISYKDYCKQKYNTEVTDLSQPLLISKGKWKKSLQGIAHQPVQLIPQLCRLTGLSDKIRKNYILMRQLAEQMRLDPEERRCELQHFINNILKHEITQADLKCWNLKFDTKFLSLSGRILKEVMISQGEKEFVPHAQYAEWSKDVRTEKVINAKTLECWLLLYTRKNHHAALSLKKNLIDVGKSMHISLKAPTMIEVDNSADSYINIIEKHAANTQMVVCVLSSDKKEVYDSIKKYLCVKCPIPSQCVVARTLERPQVEKTIAAKIVQQMNCKLGGALWKVNTELPWAMFIGIDCFHDIVNRRKSIAAFVASCKDDLTQWFSQCVFQETGQEIVSGLRNCLQAAIGFWHELNNSLPHNIIVYRDGVGDGQLQALIDHEIPQFESALKDILKLLHFTLTFIVVKKRINTRFFTETQGKFENPPPGTVIDVALTRKEWYDFFIISQHVKDGTVTPTHYNVIYDTYKFKPDDIQQLTYKLCHMYYNMSAIIRVPAPCHYAHKLAYLVGQSIHQEPHFSLTDRLFYL